MSANMNYMDTMNNTQNQQSIMPADFPADMDNTQAQKLNFLNEKLNQASAPSVAPVITHKYGFTGGPLDKFPAKRFSNEGLSQPPRAQAADPTWHSSPQPPVDYTLESFLERPSQPFEASVAGPFYPGYMDHTHDHQRFNAEMLNIYDTPARQYSHMNLGGPQHQVHPYGRRPTSERDNVDITRTKRFEPYGRVNVDTTQEKMFQPYGPQRSYTIHGQGHFSESVDHDYVAPPTLPITPQLSHTINTRKPVVKLPVIEATHTANTQQPSDSASSDSDLKYDHETCVKMADLAIKTRDHSLDPTTLGEAEAKFRSQADQILNVLTRMDQTIHRFMPDKTIYVGYGLDKVEEKFAGLRQRIVKQETLDPREIARIALHGEYIAPVHELFFVDSEEDLEEMLRVMEACIVVDSNSTRPNEPALSVDTEGDISLLQILVHAAKKVYLVDFTKLGELVFSTSVSTGQGVEISLKSVFESPSILKLFWDVRSDSALFHKFHDVTLRCVLDVQLMDLVTRRGYKGGKGRSKKKILRDHKTVKAMGQAFHERCTEIPLDVRREWLSTKDFGKLAMGLTGYETTQRFYDASGGIYAIAVKMMAEEGIAAASSGSDSEGTSATNTTSTSTSTSASYTAPVEKPENTVFPFDVRPLPQFLETYASNDVTALPVLYDHHSKHATWNAEVEDHVWLHSEKRLRDARVPGSGERLKGNENLAPEGWFEVEFLKGLDA
jgi:hypothetical protein